MGTRYVLCAAPLNQVLIGTHAYRNVIIAAGNSGDVDCIPLLKQLVHHPSELIGMHAVWALVQFKDEKISRYLKQIPTENISEMIAAEIKKLVDF